MFRISNTFDDVLPAIEGPRLFARDSVTGGFFDERTTAWSTTILRTDDNYATSLLDASTTACTTGGPGAPVAQNTVHRPCRTRIYSPITSSYIQFDKANYCMLQ